MRSRQQDHGAQNHDQSSDEETRGHGHDAPSERPHGGGRKRGRSSGNGSGNAGNGEKSKSTKLYCVCRRPDDGSEMFQCDGCKEWFHPHCVNVDLSKLKNKKAYCLNCAPSAEGKEGRKRPLDTSTTATNTTNTTTTPSTSSSSTTTSAATEASTAASASASTQSTATVDAGGGGDGTAGAKGQEGGTGEAAGATSTATAASEPSKKKSKTFAWIGSIKCEGLGSFGVSAQHVCGAAEMVQSMPSSLNLQRRLQLDKLLDYLHKCSVNSSRRRCVLRLEASGSDQDLQCYNSLYRYFLTKNRAGYVDVEGPSRDGYELMYLVPLQCNATSLPAFISQDPLAIVNKRVVTSGAQKPRLLLVLMSEHNNSGTTTTTTTTTAPSSATTATAAEAPAAGEPVKVSATEGAPATDSPDVKPEAKTPSATAASEETSAMMP